MNKKLLFACLIISGTSFGQQQVGNGDMENWDNVGSSTEEPTNWSSFKSASGGMAWAGSQQVSRSTSVRAGATGTYCARIWSNSVLGIVANGNLTLGRVNMGNSTATDASNYNYSQTSDANFSESLTNTPDSLVFWVKYTASASQEARVSAVLHDDYDYKDGYNIDAASEPHKVAEISYNFAPTNGQWVRKSVPWAYVGPAVNNTYILVTFTTNKTPGGGAANDEVLIDDVELIYNSSASIDENSLAITPLINENSLSFKGGEVSAEFSIVNAAGQEIFSGNTSGAYNISGMNGMYIITMQKEGLVKTIKVIL
jgi:hypothetical protein